MKIQWSVFYSLFLLLTLASCGGEEFGTAPKSEQLPKSAYKAFSHSSCSDYTQIKPKVDVIYFIDNSSSSYYIASDVKKSISNTVNSLSSHFDFRVIGTPLLETSTQNEDYQVLTNSSELVGINPAKRITSAGDFSFFSNAPINGIEKGLSRVVSFMNNHRNSLLRSNAYTMIVLVSNGRDLEIEEDAGFRNGETRLNTANYNARLSSLRSIKTNLNAIQLRMISLTAKSVCQPGWRSSNLSYVKIAKQLYEDSGATDNETNQDTYDLCNSNGVNSIFAAINNSIQQVMLPHEYSYWPITFAENDETVSLNDLKVHKVKSNGQSVELTRDSDWFYEGGSVRVVNTRSGPNPIPGTGEPHTGRHFIRFNSPIVYPDCVLVRSTSKTEYFGYVVLPQKPKKPISQYVAIRINGSLVPAGAMTDETDNAQTKNIKVDNPSANPPGEANPPVVRTGFMIRLSPSHYYQTGDDVKVDYEPAGI